MPRAARQHSLPQRRTQYGRVRPPRPTDEQLNAWGDLAGLYGESMRRMACRICLIDPVTRDAVGEQAKADFYADPVRYPCALPPRDQAAAYYERIQRILDKANEITTLYEAYMHQFACWQGNDFIMRVELDGHGLDVVGPVLDQSLKKGREMRASLSLLAPAPLMPLSALPPKVEADVPHELVGSTFSYLSRDGVRQTCTIHRSGHDADGQVFFVTFGTGVDIELRVSKANLMSLLERKIDADQVSSSPNPSSPSSSSSFTVLE